MEALFHSTQYILEQARKTYGAKNQILVSVEELCELASACAKYPRYDTHEKAVEELRGHVLEELGDVFNAIDHIQAIFGITDQEAAQAAEAKGKRLARWLAKSKGMEITTQDRAVTEGPAENDFRPCSKCLYKDTSGYANPCASCLGVPGHPKFKERQF